MGNIDVRLIDVNRFKRFLQALCKAGAPYDDVITLLDKEPTAYDVEKVVAEEEKFLVNYGVPKTTAVHRKIIDIIREGGIDGKF